MISAVTPVAITMRTMMMTTTAVDADHGANGLMATTVIVNAVATPTTMMMKMETTTIVRRLAARAALAAADLRPSAREGASVAVPMVEAQASLADSVAARAATAIPTTMTATATNPRRVAIAPALKVAAVPASAVVDAAALAGDFLRSIAIPTTTMTTTTISHQSKNPHRLIRLKKKQFLAHDAAIQRKEAARPPRMATCGVVFCADV